MERTEKMTVAANNCAATTKTAVSKNKAAENVMVAVTMTAAVMLRAAVGLEHSLHDGHTLIAHKFLVGLLRFRGLICCCHKGLIIAIVAMAVQDDVCLGGRRWLYNTGKTSHCMPS
jgi:hypothetical protein